MLQRNDAASSSDDVSTVSLIHETDKQLNTPVIDLSSHTHVTVNTKHSTVTEINAATSSSLYDFRDNVRPPRRLHETDKLNSC